MVSWCIRSLHCIFSPNLDHWFEPIKFDGPHIMDYLGSCWKVVWNEFIIFFGVLSAYDSYEPIVPFSLPSNITHLKRWIWFLVSLKVGHDSILLIFSTHFWSGKSWFGIRKWILSRQRTGLNLSPGNLPGTRNLARYLDQGCNLVCWSR